MTMNESKLQTNHKYERLHVSSFVLNPILQHYVKKILLKIQFDKKMCILIYKKTILTGPKTSNNKNKKNNYK